MIGQKNVTRSRSGQLPLDVLLQIVIFLFADERVEHNEEYAHAERKHAREDHLIEPGVPFYKM